MGVLSDQLSSGELAQLADELLKETSSEVSLFAY